MTETSPDSPVMHRNAVGSFSVAFVVGILAFGALFYFGDIWSNLANTRMLDVLVRVGVVQYTDDDAGFIVGVPDHELYLKARDPVDWPVIGLALLSIFMFLGFKAALFHGMARLNGLSGTLRQHASAYFYGEGYNRLLPYRLGDLAAATALEKEGADPAGASLTVFGANLLHVFALVFFAIVGVFYVGWSQWLAEILWGSALLFVAWLFLRQSGAPGLELRQAWKTATMDTVRKLLERPLHLIELCLLSIAALFMLDIAVYLLLAAFNSTWVLIPVDFPVIMMAIVGGYLASLFPVTPGGIGQFEWGFVSALYLAGVGFPHAVTVAMIFLAARYLCVILVFGFTALWRGVGTNYSEIVSTFTQQEAAAEAV